MPRHGRLHPLRRGAPAAPGRLRRPTGEIDALLALPDVGRRGRPGARHLGLPGRHRSPRPSTTGTTSGTRRGSRRVHYWMDRMATTPTPIVEKMALFWHGNLFTSTSTAMLPAAGLPQIKHLPGASPSATCTTLAPGHGDRAGHAALPRQRSRTWPASPNENFARELMELFTPRQRCTSPRPMSSPWPGPGPATTTTDATETLRLPARASTTAGTKTIFGITQNWDGPEAITEIVRGVAPGRSAPASSPTKIWSFFAYPNPAPALARRAGRGFIALGHEREGPAPGDLPAPEFRAGHDPDRPGPQPDRVAGRHHAGARPARGRRSTPSGGWSGSARRSTHPPNVSGWRQNGAWISTSAQWAKGSCAGCVRWEANDAGVFCRDRVA